MREVQLSEIRQCQKNDNKMIGVVFHSKSTLLPTSGYVLKCYKQWGNFRLNGGIYQSKSSVAGFVTIEIYDFFHRHGYVSRD